MIVPAFLIPVRSTSPATAQLSSLCKLPFYSMSKDTWVSHYTLYLKKKKEEEGELTLRHENCIILIMLSENVMKIFIRKK